MASKPTVRKSSSKGDEESTNKCAEPIVRFTDEQQLISNLSWIHFKLIKGMLGAAEIAELIGITEQYKQI
jgi:hypothetical protein